MSKEKPIMKKLVNGVLVEVNGRQIKNDFLRIEKERRKRIREVREGNDSARPFL